MTYSSYPIYILDSRWVWPVDSGCLYYTTWSHLLYYQLVFIVFLTEFCLISSLFQYIINGVVHFLNPLTLERILRSHYISLKQHNHNTGGISKQRVSLHTRIWTARLFRHTLWSALLYFIPFSFPSEFPSYYDRCTVFISIHNRIVHMYTRKTLYLQFLKIPEPKSQGM
jgi:hypothetical protein